MTKRKRDTFNVIDSVNNWVETGAHNLNPLVDPEGDANHPVNSDTSADQVPAHGLGVEAQGSASTSEPRFGLLDGPSPNSGPNVGPEPRSEVTDYLLTACEAPYPPAVGTGYLPAPEGITSDTSHERVQAAGYNPDIGETTNPFLGPEEERERTIAAFWRLLADAGYDIW